MDFLLVLFFALAEDVHSLAEPLHQGVADGRLQGIAVPQLQLFEVLQVRRADQLPGADSPLSGADARSALPPLAGPQLLLPGTPRRHAPCISPDQGSMLGS